VRIELSFEEYQKLKVVVNAHSKYSVTATELNHKFPFINLPANQQEIDKRLEERNAVHEITTIHQYPYHQCYHHPNQVCNCGTACEFNSLPR